MSDAELTALGLIVIGLLLVSLVLSFLMLAGMWKIFDKAGRRGWLALVPFYNSWVLYEVAGKPGWWSLAGLLPVAGWIVTIFMCLGLAPKFGKGVRYAIFTAIVPPVGLLMLGFGKATYQR